MLYKIKGVDKSKCNGCEKCVQVCHAHCFEMINDKGRIIAKFEKESSCDTCGDCILICQAKDSAIILEPVMKDKQGFVKEINKQECLACEKCVKLCPHHNIEICEENGKIFAKILDSKKCIADGHCSFSCPVDNKTYSECK